MGQEGYCEEGIKLSSNIWPSIFYPGQSEGLPAQGN